jgi:hypothetical protein
MIPNPFSMIHGGSAFGGADHGRRELDRKEELARWLTPFPWP